MREILFRGKRKLGGTWNYGDLVHCTDNLVAVSDEEGNFVNVRPETVGQYTGFTDKNGTKIFEGDIILVARAESDGIFVVRFMERWAAFGLRNEQSKCYLDLFQSLRNLYTVIGNIHDNPELLSRKENEQ